MKSSEMVDKVVGLNPGKVDNRHFELLLEGTGIRGEEITEALRDYLVHGVPLTDAWKKYDLNPSQFYRRLKVLMDESVRAHALAAYYKHPIVSTYEPTLKYIEAKKKIEVLKAAKAVATPKADGKSVSKPVPKVAAKAASKAPAGRKKSAK